MGELLMTDTATQEPPRLAHNRKLMDEYLAAHPTPRYPAVTEQLPCVPLELGALAPGAYNASILADGDTYLLAYRYPRQNQMATNIALARIDGNGKVLENRPLLEREKGTYDDPRLFRHNGEVYVSWLDSTWPDPENIRCVVKYSFLDVRLVSQTQPPSPEPLEKNHIPFTAGEGHLYWLYRNYPEQIVLSCPTWKAICSCGWRWPWGEPRGGTPPLPYAGKLLRFFHSSLDNNGGEFPRRYFMGAALMNDTPPFETIAWSQKPILYGSELPEKPPGWNHWKPSCVLPFGAVEHDGGWLVSVGVNDSSIAIVRVRPKDLNL